MDPSDPGRGPHPVGVVTFELRDAAREGRVLPVDLWYPARAGTRDDETSGQPAHPYGQLHRARIDATPIAAPCPVVAFSHGNRGLRQQSTFLTTHLASHGYVVVAPDHVGNTFAEMVGLGDEELRERHLAARANRPLDMQLALDHALAGDPRWPASDATRVASVGHSFGGWTALKLAALHPAVGAVCALAPVSEPFVGRKAFAPGELPLRPGVAALLVAALDDALVSLDESIRPLFERLRSPRALVGVRSADHYHFCDGIELLHEAALRDTGRKLVQRRLPYAQTVAEPRMQRLLCGLVTRFVDDALGARDPLAALTAASLSQLDPSLERLDA